MVGTIKHTTRDVDDDVAGKDSQRHAAAGAAVAALVTPGRTSARRFGAEENFEDVLQREFSDCDLVLVEGYKSLAMPKIEVIRTGINRPEVVEPVARISDGPFQGTRPDALLRRLGRDRGDRAPRRRPRSGEPRRGRRQPQDRVSGPFFVVFDLDGTLIDGYAAIGDALAVGDAEAR